MHVAAAAAGCLEAYKHAFKRDFNAFLSRLPSIWLTNLSACRSHHNGLIMIDYTGPWLEARILFVQVEQTEFKRKRNA